MFTEKLAAVKLEGKLSVNGTGRVEVFYNGQWGSVCDNGWDINDAKVVCRELGYRYAIKALQGVYAPFGTGQRWLDNVACTGDEQYLSSCPHSGWDSHNCWYFANAGVECSTTGKVIIHYDFVALHSMWRIFLKG